MVRKNKGFTLVELLIVVLILAALAAIAVPRIGASAANAKAKACATNVDIINGQIELYIANTGSAPSALTDVTQDPCYFPDDEPICPVSGGTYSLDGSTGHVDSSAHGH